MGACCLALRWRVEEVESDCLNCPTGTVSSALVVGVTYICHSPQGIYRMA